MELWIRSQDRERICRVNKLYIKGVGIYSNCDNYNDDYDYLGLYKTKERALEVLDEIQELLKPQKILSKVGKPIAETCDGVVYIEPDEYDIKELSTYVYEMPKE